MPADLLIVPGKTPLPGLQVYVFLQFPHMADRESSGRFIFL